MSQRRALIASILITLVLALSAIGIRAAMTDQSTENSAAKSTLPLLVTGGATAQGGDDSTYDDERDDESEDQDQDQDYEDQSYAASQDDNTNEDGSTSSTDDARHEEDNDDD